MTYSDEVLADSPLVYWKFEDVNGVTVPVDSSGNGRDGTMHSVPNPGFGDTGIFPVLGTSLGLKNDDHNVYVSRAPESVFDFGTDDFTIECLLNITNPTTNYQEIWSLDSSATGNGVLLYLQVSTGAIRSWCGGSVMVGTKRISDGVPHSVILLRESGVLKCYVDGLLDVSETHAGSLITGQILRFGISDGSYPCIHGDGGHFAVYDHALSVPRILARMSELGVWMTIEDPNQAVEGYIFENVGFHTVESNEAVGYVDENVGRYLTNDQEADGYIYEGDVIESIPMKSRIGIPI